MGVVARSRLALTAILITLMSVSATDYPATTDAKCNCYLTNTTTRNWFSQHKFFDFRSMAQYVNVPAPLQDPDSNTAANVTNSYFSTNPDWKNSWSIQRWNNSVSRIGTDATLLMVNSANNIYFESNKDPNAKSSTYLTMRTVRHQNFQSSAEINSNSSNYHYLSIRMLARTRGAKGAITAMFTYREADTYAQVQEADLEIRTQDPVSSIQYTNQPSYNDNGEIAGATRNITNPGRVKWSEWQHHRLDWTPGSSTWFVDGQLMSSITFQAPRDPSLVMFNSWSDGGSWSGNMSIGSEAYLQIQWIELVFNTTTPPISNAKCSSICSIDDTKTIGVPVLLPNGPGNPGNPGGGQNCLSAKYGQCAGKNWNGCLGCAEGTTCHFQNDYYSQCL